MAEIATLFDGFKDEFKRNGFANPRHYTARAAADDRVTLAALIDAYLESAPPVTMGEAEYATSAARSILAGAGGEGGVLWSRVLPILRRRAGLKRGDIVNRLVVDLDLEGGQTYVAEALHEMESGILDSVDVKRPVLESLSRALGESADTLRELGRRLGPSLPSPSAPAFTRGAGDAVSALAAEMPPVDPKSAELERRVNELFRGGRAESG